MKKSILLAALTATVMAASSTNAAVYTFSGTWTAAINNNITGGAGILSQNSSTTITSTVNVGILDTTTLGLGETLTGIEIIYTSPLPENSDTITATTSVAAGSYTFSSLSASVSTEITSPDVAAAFAGNFPNNLLFSTPYTDTDSGTGAPPDLVVNNATPWITNLTRNYNVFRLDLANPSTASLANALTSVGPDSVDFNVDTILTSQFTRNSTGDEVVANFLGVDSGTITINYYTIPEPSGVALAGLGMIGLLARRRRN